MRYFSPGGRWSTYSGTKKKSQTNKKQKNRVIDAVGMIKIVIEEETDPLFLADLCPGLKTNKQIIEKNRNVLIT